MIISILNAKDGHSETSIDRNHKPAPSRSFSTYVEPAFPVTCMSRKQSTIRYSQSCLTSSFIMTFRRVITTKQVIGEKGHQLKYNTFSKACWKKTYNVLLLHKSTECSYLFWFQLVSGLYFLFSVCQNVKINVFVELKVSVLYNFIEVKEAQTLFCIIGMSLQEIILMYIVFFCLKCIIF